jgi:hypothetical protein|tara:strand:- start:148 stop:1767 length:1620 start_codon:yes stop_codon:yes gene_type:complete
MAIFVGSDNNDSKIRPTKVGFAVSTTNPGSAAEGDSYYNGTANLLNVYDGSAWNAVGGGAGGNFEAVASGTIPNGATVIVNTDGTVGVITSSTSGGSPSNAVTFSGTTGASQMRTAAFDTVNNKVVIAYLDTTNTNGMAVVGTVSGNSINFGTPVQFDSGECEDIAIAYGGGNIAIAYRSRSGSNEYPRVVGGTVNGDSINFGSTSNVTTSTGNNCGITYVASEDLFLMAFRDYGNSYYGRVMSFQVNNSNNILNKSSIVTFDSSQSISNTLVYDSSAQKAVVFWSDVGSSQNGKAKVITATAGSNPQPHGETPFDTSGSVGEFTTAAFDSENNKIVLAYKDGNGKGQVVIGTVAGQSISFTSPAQFNGTDNVTACSTAYDSNSKKIIITYRDNGDSNKGKLIEATLTGGGTGISFGSEQVFNDGNCYYMVNVFDSHNNKMVVPFTNLSDYLGRAIVYGPAVTTTNLTANNFAGFSDDNYTNGQTAKIQIAGSVDDAQTGLTTARTHYVQNDGSLSTTAGSPSVEAGTAVSATKIIIKG